VTATAIGWIEPDWPAPAHVRVLSTLRGGGTSTGPYASLNLAAHVGDDPRSVAANRLLLREAAHLPGEPCGSSRCTARTSSATTLRRRLRRAPTRRMQSRRGKSARC